MHHRVLCVLEQLDTIYFSIKGLKKQKTSKDVEPFKGSNSSSSSKGTKPCLKSSDDQPDDEATTKHDWFKKPNKPLTPYRAWNTTKSIDFRLPQTWISNISKARQPPGMFDELMSTPIDFSVYVMNNLKIDNLTQEILVGPAYNLLKGTCKSFIELEYHFDECYKAGNDRLDWHNLEGHKYLFDLSKLLPLNEDQGRMALRMFTIHIVILYHVEDLQLRVKSYQKKLNITRPETFRIVLCDIANNLRMDYLPKRKWSNLDSQRFKEGDFLRLNLRDIKDMLLLLVQKKLSNLKRDDMYDLGMALRMFTIHIVILYRVEDLQLRVESYQKKLNITRPETFSSSNEKAW
nr:hypothetical protein [Tanacetum cinerariifolium]